MPLDGTSLLLGHSKNTTEANQTLFPILASRVSTYYEASDLLHIAYTLVHTVAYVASTYTVLVRSMMLE